MPDPDLEISGGGGGTRASRPLHREGGGPVSPKNFFWPSVWSKNKGVGQGIEFTKIYGDQSGEFVGGYWA